MYKFLFVYGTLRSEYPIMDIHSYLLAYSQFYVNGTINGKLYLNDFYPCLVEDESKIVKGEIYKILESQPLFAELDDFEDFDVLSPATSLFVRKVVKVKTDKNNVIDAWVYFYNQPTDGLTEIPSDDFIDFYTQNQAN